MSDTTDTSGQVDPATETAVHNAMAEIETALHIPHEPAPAHPSAALIDAVFVTYFTSLPVAFEMQMRPVIEAARKDLKDSLAAA